jgi:hypothetical protein
LPYYVIDLLVSGVLEGESSEGVDDGAMESTLAKLSSSESSVANVPSVNTADA